MARFVKRLGPAFAVVAVSLFTIVGGASGAGPITINDPPECTSGPCQAQHANPYPSMLQVTGGATVTDLDVVISGFTHDNPEDVDMLLVGPRGQSVVLMSDAGDSVGGTYSFTFDDDPPAQPIGEFLVDGARYQPSNYAPNECVPFGGPLDAGDPFNVAGAPTGTTLSIFDATNPNGTWSLYVLDDCGQPDPGGGGSLQSWCLAINGGQATCGVPTSVTLELFRVTCVKGGGTQVAWRTAQEGQIGGFHVYRVAGKKSTRVNRALIRAKAFGSTRGASYRLLDRKAKPRVAYTYRLEALEMSGRRQSIGSFKLRACAPPL